MNTALKTFYPQISIKNVSIETTTLKNITESRMGAEMSCKQKLGSARLLLSPRALGLEVGIQPLGWDPSSRVSLRCGQTQSYHFSE